MDEINIGVKFFKEPEQVQFSNIPNALADQSVIDAAHNTANSLPKTGDILMVLFICVAALALIISGILIYKKFVLKTNTYLTESTTVSNPSRHKKMKFSSKVIFGIIGILAALCIVIGCSSTMAHAAQALSPLISKDNFINVTVKADGSLVTSPIIISNTSDDKYVIENVSVSITPGFEDMVSTNIKLTGFNGVIYDGCAVGQRSANNLTALNPLDPGCSTQLDTQLNINDMSNIEKLYDKEIFKISLKPKQFPGHDALMQYSWPELKIVADSISNGTVPDVEFTKFKNFASTGQSVVLPIPHETDDQDKLYMRIIDFNHDDKADGTGKAGITFIAENSIDKFFKFEDINETSTNWAQSELRYNMNDKNGTINKILTSVLTDVKVKPEVVQKRYAKAYEGSNSYDYDNILTSNDTFFVPSYKELTGKAIYNCGTIENMGNEGELYKYIGNDIWANTPGNQWHLHAPSTPVMSSLNHKTCEYFESDFGKALPTGDCLRFSFDLAAMHWPEPYHNKNLSLEENLAIQKELRPDCVMERTLSPINNRLVKGLNYAGRPEDNVFVDKYSNITPCFCL